MPSQNPLDRSPAAVPQFVDGRQQAVKATQSQASFPSRKQQRSQQTPGLTWQQQGRFNDWICPSCGDRVNIIFIFIIFVLLDLL
jgi:hypothetical protein